MRKDYTVYRHRNRVTNEVFYVGSGTIIRGQERYKSRHCEKWNSIYEEFGKPIIEIVARDFPEFVLALAEENWVRGYQQALDDVDTGQQMLELEGIDSDQQKED